MTLKRTAFNINFSNKKTARLEVGCFSKGNLSANGSDRAAFLGIAGTLAIPDAFSFSIFSNSERGWANTGASAATDAQIFVDSHNKFLGLISFYSVAT